MRFQSWTLAFTLLLGSALATSDAALVSRSYEFKPGVTLEIGARIEDGLRIDSVLFRLPPVRNGVADPAGGPAGAQVTVSNDSEEPYGAGIAIALFDAEGRLLGVASGGSSLRAIRPGRQRAYTLLFDGANGLLHRADRFQITLESKP